MTGTYSYDAGTLIDGRRNPFTDFRLTLGTNPEPLTLADLLATDFEPGGRVSEDSTPERDVLAFFFTDAALTRVTGTPGIWGQGVLFNNPETYVAGAGNTFLRFEFTATPGGPAITAPEPGAAALLCTGAGTAAFGAGRVRRKKRRRAEA